MVSGEGMGEYRKMKGVRGDVEGDGKIGRGMGGEG